MNGAHTDALRQWRNDTEGCEHVAHFNNAGASLPPRAVVDRVIEHLRLEERLGGYEAATHVATALEATRASIAALVNAQPSEIALIENATRAWDMAFYAIPFERGDAIITGLAEYASNYLPFLQLKEQRGVEIVVCPDDAHGALDVSALESLCTPNTKLIAITHVPTNGGLVNPAEAVGNVANAKGILYLLDACQSAGQIALDVNAIGCDFLSVTGRKFLRGPRGTGFLYARASSTAHVHPPFVDLHSAVWTMPGTYKLSDTATKFETWECYVAGRLGLGVAVDYALNIGLDIIEARVGELSTRLRSELANIPHVRVHDKGSRKSGIVTFSHDVRSAEEISSALNALSINTSVSQPSSTPLDFHSRNLQPLVRASVHYYNTDDEVDRLLAALR